MKTPRRMLVEVKLFPFSIRFEWARLCPKCLNDESRCSNCGECTNCGEACHGKAK